MTIAHPAPAAPRPDDDLLRRARAGDRDAFSTIMTRGNKRLFRVARSVVGNDSEAEDVLQESYLGAIKAIGGIRATSGAMRWGAQETVVGPEGVRTRYVRGELYKYK